MYFIIVSFLKYIVINFYIGTDEYAKEESEKFRAFTDHYIRFVESFGKKVRLWGSLTHAKGTTPVKVSNYAVPAGQWTHIVITGDNKGTSLYVNGVLTEKLEGNRNVFANGKSIAKVQTLFFPLQYIGDKSNAFNGFLDDIKVFNSILPMDKIHVLAKEGLENKK